MLRRALHVIGVVAALFATALLALGVIALIQGRETAQAQDALDPFYTPPASLPVPGTVIRSEPLGVDVPGATSLRMLYVSEHPDGSRAVSGGMVFIPKGPATAGERPVVAWAHGTLGLGPQCAPSRRSDHLVDTTNWLDAMIERGWLVVATDYVGVGTPGPTFYLVGQSEARDVVNAVKAGRSLDAAAGTDVVVWGHSQGGHAALWTGELFDSLAPELTLRAVAAAAPAAELPSIIGAQWNTPVGWAIGPEVASSWPNAYPRLQASQVASTAGLRATDRLARECVTAAGLEGMVRTDTGSDYFSRNPDADADWNSVATAQVPKPLPASLPTLVVQSTTDDVVLAWPNAKLQESWCAAGSTLSMLWLANVTHQETAMVAGPTVVDWIADRFAGRPAVRTCDNPPPVPATN